MRIERVFGLSQLIAQQIFKIWREHHIQAASAPLVDKLSACLDTAGPRSGRGFYLVFDEYAPLRLITPLGTWTFASIDHEEEIMPRISLFSHFVALLGLDEAEDDFPSHDHEFTYKIGKVAGSTLPNPTKAETCPRDLDLENRWMALVMERIIENSPRLMPGQN